MLELINSPADLKRIPKNELPNLCTEIREKIIDVMKKNGGHLASNLGAVELTVAIHYVFDSPRDKIIFDVGHQCYTHKILTGRYRDFDKIRQKDGPSGFLRRKESIHDCVDSGHASTSISSAIGFAIANQYKRQNNHVIVVIGDGALTGGVAFEGLNFSGNQKLPLIVILNDNEMSISKNVGAISHLLNKIAVSSLYQKIADFFDWLLKSSSKPVKMLLQFIDYFKRSMKFIVGYENIFTSLGFEYIGPINGHNINELIYILERVKKNIKHPVLLHVKTVKGKGYIKAENRPDIYHGVTPSLMNEEGENFSGELTFTDVFSDHIIKLAKEHEDIIAITAAMDVGTGLCKFKKEFPNRFFDVGIAEQHAVTFSASLANAGFKPVVAIYSTFLMRALDQIALDVCLSNAPVIFAIDRAGIVGADGETHQGQFDISYLKMLPNLTLMAPADKKELELMLEYAYSLEKPVAIRYPRDKVDESQLDFYHPEIATYPFIEINRGKDILLIVIGPFVSIAKQAKKELDKNGISVGILYLRILKPLSKTIFKIIENYKAVLVIEENVFSGSVSQDIASIICESRQKILFSSINIPDSFIEHDTRKNILNELGFSTSGIIDRVISLLNS